MENKEEVWGKEQNYDHQHDGVGGHVTLPALEPDSSYGNIVVVNLNEDRNAVKNQINGQTNNHHDKRFFYDKPR